MPRKKASVGEANPPQRLRPSLTEEGRENQLIALAIDQAEKQLLEGTASSQVLVHFLRLATTKEKLEKETMELQKELLAAKTEAIRASKASEEMYAKAIAAMRKYSGNGGGDDEDIF